MKIINQFTYLINKKSIYIYFIIMDSKQIGKLIFNLDLGKFNNKTKLFESNNKDNWWRDEESFNTIKYHPLNSNTNNLLYKEYEQEYLYQNIKNNEITSEIYNNNYILYYVTV